MDGHELVAVGSSGRRAGGPDLLREHRPGPPASLDPVLRLTCGRCGAPG